MAITKALSVLVYTMICLSLATAKCPMNFEPLKKAEWINSTLNCTNFKPNNKTSIPYNPNADCCHIIKSLFKIALARYFSETEHFFLHNITTSKACVQEFQSNVVPSLGFPQHLVSSCTLDPSQFTTSTHHCAGIETMDDLNARLKYTILKFNYVFEAYCYGNIYGNIHDKDGCRLCQEMMRHFQEKLDSEIGDESSYNDPYTPRCTQLLKDLYVAKFNVIGTESYGVASCIFNVIETQDNSVHDLIVLTVSSAPLIIFVILLCARDVKHEFNKQRKNSKVEYFTTVK